MRRQIGMRWVIAALLCYALPSWGQDATDPFYAGKSGGSQAYRYVAIDSLIGTSWERVTADTGFTQMTAGADSFFVQFEGTAQLDSLRAGNTGGGTIEAVYTLSSSADATGNTLLKDVGQRLPAYKAAAGVFSSGMSTTYGFLRVVDDDDVDIAADGAVRMVWAKGLSPGNPGLAGKHQVVWSGYGSPQEVRMGFTSLGYPYVAMTDDYDQNVDSLAIEADLYDSTFHLITFSIRDNTIHLRADRRAEVSTAISNASSALSSLDTLDLGGIRGAQLFRGHMDEVYLLGDSTTADTAFHLLEYERGMAALGNAADSARVRGRAMKSDSTSVAWAATVQPSGIDTVSGTYILFERAWMDSVERNLPVEIFSNPVSPSTSRLNVIPVSEVIMPAAVIVVGKREQLLIKSIQLGSHDPSAADVVQYQVRVYRKSEARGAGGGGYQELIRRTIDAQDNPNGVLVEGPWQITGPAVVEGWAKAAAGSSYGYMEFNVERHTK